MRYKLRALRRDKGFTMEDMAQHLGYAHHSGYSEIEYGNKQVSLKNAFIIAAKLECSVEEIFLKMSYPIRVEKELRINEPINESIRRAKCSHSWD